MHLVTDEPATDAVAEQERAARKLNSPSARRVLDAAIDLFASQGFERTTIRDITSACGLTSAAAFYYHFESKDWLLHHILSEIENDLHASLDALPLADVDPVLALNMFVREIAIFTLSHSDRVVVANREFRALRGEPRENLAAERLKVRTMLEEILHRDDHTKGIFAPEVELSDAGTEVRILANAILNMVSHLAEWRRPDGALSINETADTCCRLAQRMAGMSETR
jgi:AcrR family transcriptional regulator